MVRKEVSVASILGRFVTAMLVLAVTVSAPAQSESRATTPDETPGLKATQITLVLIPSNDQGTTGRGRMFRATVMARKDDVLTVLTAAHCLSSADADLKIRLLIGGEVTEGSVISVIRNPAYRPNSEREVPGADNALAKLRFKPETKSAIEAIEAIKPVVGFASRTYPRPGGETVLVRMIDQKGVEHALKAGNYSNPRLLEWGPAYKPIPGDSGGGVFVMSGGSEGRSPRPVLVGIIVSTDARGGMASLVSKEMRWIADELVP
jgi:hypothetical protein